MKKRLLALALTLCMLMTLIPAAFAAIRETEDNGTMAAATPMSVNTEYVGNINDNRDKDYYSFTLTKNEMVTIQLGFSSNPKVTVELYDSASKKIFTEYLDKSNIPSPWSSNRRNMPAGTYYICIEPWGGTNNADYTLNVLVEGGGTSNPDTTTPTNPVLPPASGGSREIEPNGSMSEGTAIGLNSPMLGNISDSSDKDYYKFVLSQNDIITLQLAFGSNPKVTLDLYNSSSRKITGSYLDSSNLASPWNSNRHHLPAGTYYICVSPWGGTNNADYELTVKAQFNGLGLPAGREVEYNNDMASANSIQASTTYVANISDNSDKDYFKLNIPADGEYILTVGATGGNPKISFGVYNASNKKVDTFYFDKTSIAYPWSSDPLKLTAGNNYLAVDSWGGTNDADYTFSLTPKGGAVAPNPSPVPTATPVPTPTPTPTPTPPPVSGGSREIEPNGSMSEGTVIGLNSPMLGNISDSSDKDYYKFVLSQNDIITLQLAFGSNPKVTLDLYNSSSRKITGNYLDSSNLASPWSSTRHHLPAGTYYICVSPWGGTNDADYQLTVKAQFNGLGLPAGREVEYNNDMASANSIQASTTYVANISDNSDKDYFKLNIPADGEYILTVGATGGNPKISFGVYNASNKKVDTFYFDKTSIAYPWSSDPLKLTVGNNYLAVDSWGGTNDADYTFSLTPKGGAVAPNPSPSGNPGTSTGVSSWAKAEVEQAIALGFVPGELQSNYQSNITRQEFCKLIVQMLMAKSSTLDNQDAFLRAYYVDLNQNPFSDTSDQYVKIAYALQIVNGTGSGMFSPNKSITRQEAASMLQRAAAVFQFTDYKDSATSFSDRGSIASWASASVNFVSANGIMGGSGGAFSPHGNYSREQSILTALRLFNAFPRSSYAV